LAVIELTASSRYVAPERRGGRQDFLREIEPVVKIGAEMLDVNEHLTPKRRGCARGKAG